MSRRKPTAAQRLRHSLVTAWRGVEDGPILDLPTQTAADLVLKIVTQSGIADRLKIEDVLAAWKSIVGDFVAQHSHPESVSRNVLHVRVLQPAVLHSLSLEKPRILKRLQERFGIKMIKEVRFKHG